MTNRGRAKGPPITADVLRAFLSCFPPRESSISSIDPTRIQDELLTVLVMECQEASAVLQAKIGELIAAVGLPPSAQWQPENNDGNHRQL